MIKKFVILGLICVLLGGTGAAVSVFLVSANLPKLSALTDYNPLLVSEVYDVKNRKIGEFFRERRILVPYEKIPPKLVHAFVAAEDSKFFEHGGIDYIAILRAFLTNLKEGHKAQGASTITQQVARSLLLSKEKTYTRKIREVLLSYRIEANLTKDQILYLYLNQIYLGQGANGVEAAAQSYFRKSVEQLTLPEMAILAGLPQAPSKYSPTTSPKDAKRRQLYVLDRMATDKYITADEAKAAAKQPVTFYMKEVYDYKAPDFLETVRQELVKDIGGSAVLDEGIKVYTTLDLDKQLVAQTKLQEGLRDLDKKQGFRGPTNHFSDAKEIAAFMERQKRTIYENKTPVRIMNPDGTLRPATDFEAIRKTRKNTAPYLEFGDVVQGVVLKVDDNLGIVYVQIPDGQGLIGIDTMAWARKPNPKVHLGYETITHPSAALAEGDVIGVRLAADVFKSDGLQKRIAQLKQAKTGVKTAVANVQYPNLDQYTSLKLEQEPLVESALLSLDIKKQSVIAMVGGYDFKTSKLNRTIQSVRQTGSSFKPIVYAAALDSGFTPATVIMDAPIVYQDEKLNKMKEDLEETGSDERPARSKKAAKSKGKNASKDAKEDDSDLPKVWKPSNYGSKFGGDILFRNALVQSKNIPTIRIMEATGVDKVSLYARRLGVFSPLNMDLSMSLGSSSVSLYEMTKAFSVFANSGRRIRPKFILDVKARDGKSLVNNVLLDDRFERELTSIDKDMDERRKKFMDTYEVRGGLIVGTKGLQNTSTKGLQNTSTKGLQNTGQKGDGSKEPPQKDPTGSHTPTPSNVSDSFGGSLVQEALRFDPRFVKDTKVQKDPNRAPIFFEDPDQLISPQTAYLMTTLLSGVVNDPNGTGGKARAVGKPVAGKTGSTSDYYDAWFVGFSPDIASGVWVGFDREASMGVGATGGDAALPIWVDYMKEALKDSTGQDFATPPGIVFANVDNETGRLASSSSRRTLRQAFLEGTEPGQSNTSAPESAPREEEKDLLKEDLSQ